MYFLDECSDISSILSYIKRLIKVVQIFVPILLIIIGSVDMLKGIVSADEKKIRSSRTTLIKRFGAAIAVFLVPWLVNFLINAIGGSSKWLECWNSSGNRVEIKYPDYN